MDGEALEAALGAGSAIVSGAVRAARVRSGGVGEDGYERGAIERQVAGALRADLGAGAVAGRGRLAGAAAPGVGGSGRGA